MPQLFGPLLSARSEAFPPQRKVHINPLLHFDISKVTSATLNQNEFYITLMMENGEQPIAVWFKSLVEMNEAYAEWGYRAATEKPPVSERPLFT